MDVSRVVELAHVSHRFGAKHVLNDVSLGISTRDVVVIEGENGAGKSTLLRILGGMMKPTRGRVVYGQSVRVGFAPDRFPTLRFRLAEYLELMAEMSGMKKAERIARTSELLAFFHLESAWNEQIEGFSKGMLQKTSIAQAIFRKPDVLLLDEPFSGLDAAAQDDLMPMLNALVRDGVTLVMTNHIRHLDVAFRTQSWRVHEGKVTVSATSQVADERVEIHYRLPTQAGSLADVKHVAVPDREAELVALIHAGARIEQVTTVDKRGIPPESDR